MADDTDNSAGASSEAPAENVTAPDTDFDVSRETAATVFGDRLPLARRYAELLATDGVLRGLIGPREVPRLWERHLLNCAVVEELIGPDLDVLDIGSGAGLPGIPLAIARPDLFVTLVEPMERRTVFLDATVAELGLPNVAVLRARAENVQPRGKADVVTCRAVAAIDRLAEWGLPLLRHGGELLAVKGASAAQELAKHPRLGSRRCQAGDAEVLRCGTAVLDTPTTVIRVPRR